ncbi:hypothetical protein F2Q70_00001567 [Brassica cretica]|uniref:Uncharacterized protein n=1 Tax=Brassica cretica TaxID=69181 RepID=A0A8S9IQT7_BRACR|nr:hypothetical protein F2Q70_00001567 [Brassica cretica]
MGDVWTWIISFLILITLVGFIVYQLICLADLEFDYINPYDSASRINFVVLPEFFLQGFLCFFYLVTGHWFMALLGVPYLYYNFQLYSKRQHLVDVTEIFNLLDWEKKKRLFKLAYMILTLFLTIFCFFINNLVSLPFTRPDQIEILLAFKNEFPNFKCDFKKLPYSKQMTKSWTNKGAMSFDGVVFDSETGVVTELNLGGACLSGTLSANSSLFRFHHLSFTGDIPLSLCNQTYQGVLDLSHNNFSGSIPRCLSNSVEYLNLRNNNLIGRLPDIFDKTGSLRALDVSHNQITGKLPSAHNLEDKINHLLEGISVFVVFLFKRVSSGTRHNQTSKARTSVELESSGKGYGPGVLFGLAIGQVLFSYKPVLFFKLFCL